MRTISFTVVLAATCFMAACGDGKAPEVSGGGSSAVMEQSKKVVLLESGILGMRSACPTGGAMGCRELTTILEHKALVFAARCDGGASIVAKFEVRKEGARTDELYITWYRVDAGGQTLDDSHRFVAAISGENVDVGYLVGRDKALSNPLYRERMGRDAPNAFARLAYGEQGDCVKLK